MRILIALFIIAVSTAGCGRSMNNGASSPKAIADILFEALQENAFGKVADLVPEDETDKEAFVRQTSEEEANERKYNRKKWVDELEVAFNIVRSKYNDKAWKSAKIISYDGTDGRGYFRHPYIIIQLTDRREVLYVGEVEQKDGKWYLVSAPEWD